MKALVWKEYGDPDAVLSVRNVAQPTEAPVGCVIIKVAAAALNPIDKMRVTGGLKSLRPDELPAVLGYDVSGVIDQVGEGVTGWAVRDMVVARCQSGDPQPGSIAEYCLCTAEQLAKKPENVSHADAASLPLAGQTAMQALRKIGCTKGSRVFISGGAGGVGTLAIQIAKLLGAETVATTASPGEKTELVQSLGCDIVVDYKNEKFEETLSDFDCAFDTTGESEKCAQILKKGGKTITIAGTPTVEALQEAGMSPNFIERSSLQMGRQSAAENAHTAKDLKWGYMVLQMNGKDMTELVGWVSEGKIKAVVDGVWPLDKAKEAATRSFLSRDEGKCVVQVTTEA